MATTPVTSMASIAASTTQPSSSTTSHSHRNLTIILSVVLGSLGLFLLAALFAWLKWRRIPKEGGRWGRCINHRRFTLRNSITPIADEEIETWRLGSTAEKPPYAADNRKASLQYDVWSEKKHDGPISPTSAHAPNARYGLTDSSIPGAAPFVASSPPQRNVSKLQKSASFSRSKHQRHKSSRSSVADRPPTPFNEGGKGDQGPKKPEVPYLQNKRSESFDLDQVAQCQKLG